MGGGSTPSSTSYGSPSLFNWQSLLPPWVQQGQQMTLPWLMGRAMSGGLTPEEEKLMRSTAEEDVRRGTDTSLKALGSKLAMSGVSDTSPAAVGARGDIMTDQSTNLATTAANLAKLKMGAKETAISQLMTGLYTPPPYAVGQTTMSQSSGGGGGGK